MQGAINKHTVNVSQHKGCIKLFQCIGQEKRQLRKKTCARKLYSIFVLSYDNFSIRWNFFTPKGFSTLRPRGFHINHFRDPWRKL